MKTMLKKINWTSVVIFIFGVIVGIINGVIISKSPLKINTEIDISSIVALLALFTATVVVPFKINNHLSNRRNRKSILTNDIDELLKLINQMCSLYEEIYSDKSVIAVKHQRILLSLTRKINNRIDSICGQIEQSDKLGDFKIEVSLFFNKNMLPAYTEKFLPGNKITEIDCIKAINETETIIGVLKSKRYDVYE